MIDSPWEQLPPGKFDRANYLRVTLDVYCPGQTTQVREETLENGVATMEMSVRSYL